LAVFEYLKRKGNIKNNIIDLSRYRLKDNMEAIKRDVKKINYDNAWKVIKLANKVLHSKKERPVVYEEEAYNNIKFTLIFIENLFN
jgi:hypothetical protein